MLINIADCTVVSGSCEMSLRPRREKKPTVNNLGSILGPAIDLKPVQNVGVGWINNTEQNPNFVIEVYFGPIREDTVKVSREDYMGQRYLRFKLNLIESQADREAFAKRIETNILALIDTGFDKAKHIELKVCDSPANSSHVVCFPEKRTSTSSVALNPMTLAKAITGVEQHITFEIDMDGSTHGYVFKTDGELPTFLIVVTQVY